MPLAYRFFKKSLPLRAEIEPFFYFGELFLVIFGCPVPLTVPPTCTAIAFTVALYSDTSI